MTRLLSGSLEHELLPLDAEALLTLVVVARLLHLSHVVEPADRVGRPEGLAGLDLLLVQLLDEADVPSLVAPRLADGRRVERQAAQPRAGFAIDLHLVGADHPLRDLVVLALV